MVPTYKYDSYIYAFFLSYGLVGIKPYSHQRNIVDENSLSIGY